MQLNQPRFLLNLVGNNKESFKFQIIIVKKLVYLHLLQVRREQEVILISFFKFLLLKASHLFFDFLEELGDGHTQYGLTRANHRVQEH